MENKKCEALSGKNNKRLNSKTLLNQNNAAAWSEEYKLQPTSNVSTPSIESTIHAKKWVDNGSRL